jgi:hypothetical protein
MSENLMGRLAAAAVARQCELKPKGVAELLESKASRAKDAPKAPADVQRLVFDYVTDVEVLDRWRELLALVAEVPALPDWSGRYWSTALDWVVELEPKRAALVAAGGQDAEVHHLREAV